MNNLVTVEDFDNFKDVHDFPPQSISSAVLDTVRELDNELRPRAILSYNLWACLSRDDDVIIGR